MKKTVPLCINKNTFSILGECTFPLLLALAMSQLDPLLEELGSEYYKGCKSARYNLRVTSIMKGPGTKTQRKEINIVLLLYEREDWEKTQ